MKKIFSMLLMLCLCVACSDSEDELRSLVLDENTPSEQTIYADETSGAEGISFYCSSAWTAEVRAVSRAAVDWIELSQYTGGPGNFTLTLKVKKNDTGADRKAQIVITSGDTNLVISIEQKAQTKDEAEGIEPEVPAITERVVKISKTGYFSNGELDNDSTIITFTYDAKNRISKEIGYRYILGKNSDKVETTYTYSTDAEGHNIISSSTTEEALEYGQTEKYIEEMTMDASNRVVSSWHQYDGPDSKTFDKHQYDEEGHIIYAGDVESDGDFVNTYWTNDDITKVVWSYQNETTLVQYNMDVLNNASIDLLEYICFRDLGSEGIAFHRGDVEKPFYFDYFGKRGEHMPSNLKCSEHYYNYAFEYKLGENKRIEEIRAKDLIDSTNDNRSIYPTLYVYKIEYK